MSKIIGIDLGTTNSVVAAMEAGKPTVIANADGSRLTPSVVAFNKDGERLVGTTAKRQAITNPRNTIFSVKRFMGRRHSEVAEEEKMVSYKIEGAANEPVKIKLEKKSYTPPEISAMILADLKKAAEEYLGEKITQAVITVPAYFNDAQRQATKDAGRIAGLEVKRIINEPTAASLAYGLEKKKNERIAVFDLGGGTFDISILEVGDGVFEVKSTNGDTHLGGDNFDEVLINWLADEFKKQEGIDLRKDIMALQRLKEAAEKAKCELSTMLQTDINLPFITADASGPKHFSIKLTRAQLEELVRDVANRTRKPCLQALEDAGVTPSQIDQVVLVGGSTRMPLIQNIVKEIFGKEPHKGVNPDEVVAVGAAIQAGILMGDKNLEDILLLDVTPLSLGIETMGGVMTVLIERNSTIPVEKKEVFSTAEDNQPGVDVHVLQGERAMANDNRTLGKFRLDQIPPAPRGVPQIEVTFKIDANGILNVSAKDKGTDRGQSITIKSSSGLSEEEIKKMCREAEQHSKDDKDRKEIIDLRNQGDHIIYSMEKTIKEYESKISSELKSKINTSKEELKKAMAGTDAPAIRKAIEKFQTTCQELGQVMYSQCGQQCQGQSHTQGQPYAHGHHQQAPEPQPCNNDVIDAEFEVKN